MHLILFDIDGTLIQGHGMGRRALERAFAEVFHKDLKKHPDVNEVFFAGSTDMVIIEEMAQAFHLYPDAVKEQWTELEAAYLRHLKITVNETPDRRACPGVKELLERLRVRDEIVLGLLTGNLESGARVKLDPFGLNEYFDFGAFGSDGPDRNKLAVLAVERAEERFGKSLERTDVMVVGDTLSDVSAAVTNGYWSAAVATGWCKEEELVAAGAHAVFPDLSPEHGFEGVGGGEVGKR